MSEGPWDREWVQRRLRLVGPALKRHQDAFPEADQFTWSISEDFRPEQTADEATELKIAHTVHSQGSFCSAGDSHGKPRT